MSSAPLAKPREAAIPRLAESGADSAAGSGTDPARRPIRRLPRDQRVGDIEAAARIVFSRRGYAGASIAEIAAEAGVAEGTIYKFFESKRQLVIRVIELWYGQMMAEFETHLPAITGARNKIRFIVRQHLGALAANPELARLCANEVRNGGDYYQSELHALNRRYTHVFVEACREGVANGELRPDTPIALVRDLIFGGIEHHIAPMLYGRAALSAGLASADAIVDTVMAGIATAVPRPLAVERAGPSESIESKERVEKAEQVWQRLDAAARRLEAAADRIAAERAPPAR